jgi:dihydroxy-acid dehydratase
VHDGDSIEIDIRERRIDLHLSKAELKRRKAFFAPKQKKLAGILARYARMVGQADKGAVLERYD